LSTEQQTLPDSTIENINEIAALTSLSVEELIKEYKEILSDPYFQTDSFKTDEERYRYADGILWSRYRGRRPTKEIAIIPLGFDGIRITRSGDKRGTIYAAVRDSNKQLIKTTVSLVGDTTELAKSINYGQGYRVKLVEFKFGYGADNRSKFENPQLLPFDLITLFKNLGTKEIPDLSSAAKYPSARTKTTTGEFIDRLDWRIVRGIVTRINQFSRKDGTQAAVYNIMDMSLGTEPSVDAQGNILYPSFTVWCDPIFMKYGVESEVYAVGTISIDPKTNIPSMNAINIIPIHPREMK